MQNLKIHSSTSAQARFLIGYIDFDVLMIQELAVQRINCLVNRLFGDEVELSAVRNGSNRCALSWRGDLFDKSGGEGFGRLYIDPYAREIFESTDGGNSDAGIVGQRAQYAF